MDFRKIKIKITLILYNRIYSDDDVENKIITKKRKIDKISTSL